MAITRTTVGTGITAMTEITYTGDEAISALFRDLVDYNRRFAEGGGRFGADTVDLLKSAKASLEGAGLPPFPRDSAGYYADRLLRLDGLVKHYIEKERRADAAAHFAFQMGFLACQAAMKEAWEKQALEGARTSKKRAESLRRRHENSANLTREVGADYEAEAARLGKGKSKIALALVARKHGLTEKAALTRVTAYRKMTDPRSLESGE